MLAYSVVIEIDRLLKEGQLSQRKIAKRFGVSRGSVSAIASGERALFGRAPAEGVPEGSHQLPIVRCPHCGFYVQLPCLVCRTRGYREKRQIVQRVAAEQPPVVRRARRVADSGRRSRRARVA